MKKVIYVIAQREKVTSSVINDLKIVFEESVDYCGVLYENIEKLKNKKIDIILISQDEKIKEIKEVVKEDVKILPFHRTFWEKEVKNILEKIEKNSNVLVVNDNLDNTMETINSLKKLNSLNLNLIPHISEIKKENVTLAITPDEIEFVPKYIKEIINIGNRHLDFITFLDIFYYLKIFDERLLINLIRYCNKIKGTFSNIEKQYFDTIFSNIQMHSLLKSYNQGVLIVDKENLVVLGNSFIENLFSTKISEGKTSINEIFPKELLEKIEENKESFSFSLNNKKIEVIVKKEKYLQQEYRIMYFNDITYLRALEESLFTKTKEKGHFATKKFEDLIYTSNLMQECINLAKIFSSSNKTILITGESGTGKEIFAQAIHNFSNRKLNPFVAINCSAFPAGLLESELFGYEKGAFTGADSKGKIGLFEQANNGTIFLDEIGDMPLELQVKLLRVLQEKKIIKLGGLNLIPIDVRIIAATNQDLIQKISEGTFRKDLYYRINILPLYLPPIKERKEDIIPLFKYFTKDLNIPTQIEKKLINYDWPGNVREIENVADYYSLMKNYQTPLPKTLEKNSAILDLNDSFCLLDETDIKILNLVDENNRIGRERLHQLLKSEISEYNLRLRLEKLKENGFLEVYNGRRGNSVTEKYKKFKLNKNNIKKG